MVLNRCSVGVGATLVVFALLLNAGAAVPVDAAGPAVSVTNASHTPTTPVVGEPFEVSATVTNFAGSDGTFRVNEVAVEVPGAGPSGYTEVDDLGTLTPGGSLSVTLPVVVDDAGWHRLTIHVYGQTESGQARHIEHPVTVRVVEEQRPQLDVEFDDGVVGADSAVNVTVANGQVESIRNLRLELAGDGVRIDRPSRVRSVLAAESDAHYAFEVTPRRVGVHELSVELTYTTSTGTTRTVTDRFDYRAEALDNRVRLDVSTVRGERPAVEVVVVNLGNAPLEDVVVTGTSGEASISTGLLDSVPASDSRTVRLNVTDLAASSSSLAVTAEYDVAGERETTRRDVAAAFVPGRIDLTGIDTELTADGTVRLSGTASNVGTTQVQAVTVRVRPAENVTPANPSKEYFVGAVDASDFASFTVTARVAGDSPTTIPLEVSYLVDGEERTRTVDATYDPPTTPERSGGGGLPLLGLGVVLAAVVVVGVVLWRRRRAT